MKILVSGSRGLIGSSLVTQLTSAGHFVVRLVRDVPDRDRGDIFWDPVSARIERAKLEKFDAVVHLAGESLNGLWTASKREAIHKSRVAATEFLMQTIAGLTHKPKVIVSASGVGIYGSRGDEWLQETSPAGSGWLATLTQEWEAATSCAQSAGIRVVRARMGAVLSPKGGLLASMIKPFKLGLGGRLGDGRHYMSWVCMTDLVLALQFALEKESLVGPVNICSPEPATNIEFTKALSHVLDRPALLPIPALVLNALPGNMTAELLLASQRCQPAKLTQHGYKIEYVHIEEALRHLLDGAM